MEHELATQLMTQIADLKTTVEAQNSGLFNLIIAGLGGIFGITASWVPIVWREHNHKKHETKTLLFSLLAEITAMSRIIRARGYLEGLREMVAVSMTDQQLSFSVNVPTDYFHVYKSNTAKLGLLDSKDAAQIVYLYHLVESVVQDVSPGGVLAEGIGGKKALEQDIEFLEKALTLADDLVKRHKAICNSI